MFKSSKCGVTITAVLDIRHQKKNGDYPVKIRVTYRSNSWYYPTNQYFSRENWNQISSSEYVLNPDSVESIEEAYILVKTNVYSLVERRLFSFNHLKNAVKGINRVSLNSLLDQKIEELEKEKQISTMNTFQATARIIKKHFPKEVAIEEIDYEWLKSFEKYLLKDRRQATAYLHIRNIRTIVNLAIRQGYISKDKYPFGMGGYQFKLVYGRKKALTKDEINKIIHYKPKSKELKKYRDLWLFMYLCNGITIDDLISLKYDNIFNGEIFFVRNKTKRTTSEIKEIRASILPEMQKIMNRWGNKVHPNNYIFPLIKHTANVQMQESRKKSFGKTFNRYLEIIGNLLEIDNFTTITARHSYATVLKHNGVNISFISESLGHNNVTTTEHYLAQFRKEERAKNAAYLLKI